jgi:tetratricopeptide (TPR) repeat protein
MSRNVPGIMRPVAKQLAAALLGATLLLAANFLPIATSAAADKPDDKPKISAAAGKTLKAAQDALEKQDYPTALTHLKETEALPNKTDFDEYTLNQMYLFYYSRTNDMADAEKVLEYLVGSPYLDKADLPARLRTLAQINYQAKDYDKAIQYGERAIKEGGANDDVYTLVDQAYYLKGDYPGALKSINAHMDVATKAGQPVNEGLLKLALSTCLKLNDNDCTTHALDRRVAAYPTPDNWRELLYTIIQTPGQSDPFLLQVYRLAFDIDVLKGPEDYMEMATLANDQGSPGEAQRVLEAGRQKNVFSTPALKTHSAQLLESVKKKVETDQASLSKIATDAQAAKTGTKDVALGLAYFSYQQYDKAAEALTNGLAKGGLKNEADARLILGIAQLHAGKKDDAQKTFDQVKGDPKLERLAHLWQIRAHQP